MLPKKYNQAIININKNQHRKQKIQIKIKQIIKRNFNKKNRLKNNKRKLLKIVANK